MTTLTQALPDGAFLVSEANGHRSRDTGLVAINQALLSGQVVAALAIVAGVTSAAAAVVGNTGNGLLSLAAPAVSARVKNGVYRAVCVLAAANGGTFRVENPEGVDIGRAMVGVAFDKEVKFTIADGATDFVVGDAFEITVGVEAGDLEFKPLDPTATDGSEVAAAVSFARVKAATTRKRATFMRRQCELRAVDLTWPAGITAPQKAAAVEQLAARGIILR